MSMKILKERSLSQREAADVLSTFLQQQKRLKLEEASSTTSSSANDDKIRLLSLVYDHLNASASDEHVTSPERKHRPSGSLSSSTSSKKKTKRRRKGDDL